MIVVNLYGGPGVGKSTTAAMVFSLLKQKGVNAEYVPEFAKDLTWHGRQETLKDQVYVLGKQHHKLFMLEDQVEVVVTDSPLLLTLHYGKDHFDSLKELALDLYMTYDNYDVFLVRTKPYNPKGRNQTEDEAKDIDVSIREILRQHSPCWSEVHTDPQSAQCIANAVMDKLEAERNYYGG